MINHFIDQVKNLEGTNLQLIAKIKNEDATNKMIERAKKELLIQLAKRNSTNNSGNSNSKFKFSLFQILSKLFLLIEARRNGVIKILDFCVNI